MRKTRTLSVLVCGALLALAACGGSGSSKGSAPKPAALPKVDAQPTQAFLLSSVDRTSSQKTAHFTMKISEMVGDSGNQSITADGSIDFANKRMQMTTHVGTVSAEMRVVDGSLYTKTGGSWNSNKISSLTGDASSPDVSSYLTYLRAVSDDVTEVGTEQLRGVDTTHFTATLDLKKAIDASNLSDQDHQLLKAVVDTLGSSTFPADVWIDTSGLLRKIAFKFDASKAASGTSVDISLEFYDFGTPVSIDAPVGASDETNRAQDRAAQSDLRNSLTAEKVTYTDNQAYSSDAAMMKQIEPSLDWGGKLKVVVGDAMSPADKNTVCLSEVSKSGTNLVIADVAAGPHAGTYYAQGKDCPADAAPAELAKFDSAWADDGSSGETSVSSDSVPSDSAPSDSNQTASDLRNALTAEKTYYTDSQAYSDSPKIMKQIESSLDWGGKLTLVVGDAMSKGDMSVVCLSEPLADGSGTLAIGDVASGPSAGTYYGKVPCPAKPTPANVAAFGSSPW